MSPKDKNESFFEANDRGDEFLSLENQYSPESYLLDLDINHLKPYFNGKVRINFKKNLSQSQTSSEAREFKIKLHSKNLVITKAALDSNSKSYSLKVSYLKEKDQVELGCEIEEQNIEDGYISITFIGKINSIGTFKDRTEGVFKTNYLDSLSGRSDNYILATHTQPKLCRQIFPLVDESIAKCPIKLSITADSRFKVISNEALDKEPIPISFTSRSVFSFKKTPPIAPSVFGFVIGDFQCLEGLESNILVRIFCPIGEVENCEYPLHVTQKVLSTLQTKLNVPYPFSKLDFIALPFLSDGAMENWGMINIISSQLLVSANESPKRKAELRQLIAHELVHQWVGNMISFDDWTSLWFNESFATFLGVYVLKLAQIDELDYMNEAYELHILGKFESMMDQDCEYDIEKQAYGMPSIFNVVCSLKDSKDSTTHDYFDAIAYERGIILLSMVATLMENENSNITRENSCTTFLTAVKELIEQKKYGTIKLLDFWKELNNHSEVDILSFAHSWSRSYGYPLVQLSISGNEIMVEQNAFIRNGTCMEYNLENIPYHVPLAIRSSSSNNESKIVNEILTDRRKKLSVPLTEFIFANSNQTGYYRAKYSPELIEIITPSICNNRLTTKETIMLLRDLETTLYSSSSDFNDIFSLLRVVSCFKSKSWQMNFSVLNQALNCIQRLNETLIRFSSYKEFEIWYNDFISSIYLKVGSWDKIFKLSRSYSVIEAQVRNSILLMGSQNRSFQELANKLFKVFLNPSNNSFVPKELFSSMFNLTMANANQKTYKQILQFVKSSDVSNLKHSNATVADLQTCAVTSLSFTNSDELLKKSLNFVMTNIDSKLIELALVGFEFKSSKEKTLTLWHWYTLHFDEWMLKSFRKGSKWAQQLSITMKSINTIVLGNMMQFDDELLRLKEKFIEEKVKTLSGSTLLELMEELENRNTEKVLIANNFENHKMNIPKS